MSATTDSHIFKIHLPLLVSGIFTVSEFFICSVALGYLPDADFHRATMIGLVLPLAFLYESPIYELISTSTALSKSKDAFAVLKRYFYWLAGILTAIGVVLFYSPLSDWLFRDVMRAPDEMIATAGPSFIFVISWVWFVGYRRLGQGLLIRSNRSAKVSYFSIIRVTWLAFALLLFCLFPVCNGTMATTISLTSSVLVEAALVHWEVSKLLNTEQVAQSSTNGAALSLFEVNRFYSPLVVSALTYHLSLPLAAWAMFRLPSSFDSLAVWGSISGLFWMISAIAQSFVNVSIYFIDQTDALPVLKRYATKLKCITLLLALSIAAAPLFSELILESMLKLHGSQLQLAQRAMALGAFWPVLRVMYCVPYARLINARKTRATMQAIVINVGSLSVLLYLGVWLQPAIPGLFLYLLCLTASSSLNYLWLESRSSALTST